jgi:hypothetical protein
MSNNMGGSQRNAPLLVLGLRIHLHAPQLQLDRINQLTKFPANRPETLIAETDALLLLGPRIRGGITSIHVPLFARVLVAAALRGRLPSPRR